ncbi:MAG: 3-phosphoglycerate dehydrogenase [Bacteroidales bacterium]|nr:3-phosphoglycerate dehydrogenase [Bacteroidales bacterium]
MKKILVATEKPFAPVAVKGIRQITEEAGYVFMLLEKYTSPQALLDAVAQADAMIIRSDQVNEQVISAGKQLSIVVRAGAGYDNVDLKAATARGIVVMNTPGQNSNAVAELALGMMVYMARNQFNGSAGTELSGKTLGIHAFGNVGRLVASIASGFGMEISAFDPFLKPEDIERQGIRVVHSVGDLYRSSQYISLHIPANEQTRNSINYELLSMMPEGATLVNTARKEVIVEDGLVKMFRERKDFRYVSDIAPACQETIASEFPGRFFFTPKKMGAQTAEANINAGLAAARQIVSFFENGDTRFKVN